MNIKELKELIKSLPDEMPVVVDGYERGLKKVEKTDIVEVFDYKNDTTLYGEYIDKNDQFFDLCKAKSLLKSLGKAFYISREYLDEDCY